MTRRWRTKTIVTSVEAWRRIYQLLCRLIGEDATPEMKCALVVAAAILASGTDESYLPEDTE